MSNFSFRVQWEENQEYSKEVDLIKVDRYNGGYNQGSGKIISKIQNLIQEKLP